MIMRNSHRLKSVSALAVAASLLLTACAGEEPAEPEAADGAVDLGPGESREEQIEEIGVVVGLLEEHMDVGMVLRSDTHDEWSPEYHAEHRRPIGGCPDNDQLRSEVFFTHPEIDFEDAYLAAEAISENLGFTPNEALNNLGLDGSNRMIFSSADD